VEGEEDGFYHMDFVGKNETASGIRIAMLCHDAPQKTMMQCTLFLRGYQDEMEQNCAFHESLPMFHGR